MNKETFKNDAKQLLDDGALVDELIAIVMDAGLDHYRERQGVDAHIKYPKAWGMCK